MSIHIICRLTYFFIHIKYGHAKYFICSYVICFDPLVSYPTRLFAIAILDIFICYLVLIYCTEVFKLNWVSCVSRELKSSGQIRTSGEIYWPNCLSIILITKFSLGISIHKIILSGITQEKFLLVFPPF